MIPDNLLYSDTHEWLAVDGDTATMGITHFAQEQLGDLTYVELPAPGDTLSQGAEMGTVESVKAASELYSPVDGEVLDVNQELEDAPELVNEDPYGKGWMIKIKLSGKPQGLLDAAAYKELTEAAH